MVSIVLPPLYEVRIDFPGETTGATARASLAAGIGDLHGASQAFSTSATIEDGSAQFLQLPEGRYRISSQDLGQGMLVDVPGGPYQFEPNPAGGWLLRISDSTGFLANTGLLHGDLVKAIDGQPFSASSQLSVSNHLFARLALFNMLAAERETPLAFEIVREGQSLVVLVSTSPSLAQDEVGGQLEVWQAD